EFRRAGIQVAIGGFHVSGCISMLPKLPADIQALLDDGVAIFAGEAEGRMEAFLRDALQSKLKPIYNYLSELPGIRGAVTPFLTRELANRYMSYTSFDAGRGCPFKCSFCTIINVQGNKSRWRDANDVETLVRTNWAQGVKRFFISDDNFARNRNWESIFDRLIELRNKERIRVRFLMQVDTMCHKIPGFV
ncbi:MAG: radical SAM protein, partial [Alteromonas sp.]|nr:radical SAM protein [Alteromonas sp.]